MQIAAGSFTQHILHWALRSLHAFGTLPCRSPRSYTEASCSASRPTLIGGLAISEHDEKFIALRASLPACFYGFEAIPILSEQFYKNSKQVGPRG